MKKLTYRVVDKDDFHHPALQDQGDLWEDIRAESPEHAAQRLCEMVDKDEQVYQKAGRGTFLVDCPDGSRLTILVKVKKQVCYLPSRVCGCDWEPERCDECGAYVDGCTCYGDFHA